MFGAMPRQTSSQGGFIYAGREYSASLMETLINSLCGRIAALRGARNLNIFLYMPRFLRSVRLALHPAQRINQCFLRKRNVAETDSGTS
jgi:hypothetical protein